MIWTKVRKELFCFLARSLQSRVRTAGGATDWQCREVLFFSAIQNYFEKAGLMSTLYSLFYIPVVLCIGYKQTGVVM